MDKVEADLNRIRAKLRTPQFLDRAPAEVVEKERALDKELTERLTKISERMKTFGG
jgi:valyl-tRNA synthetase